MSIAFQVALAIIAGHVAYGLYRKRNIWCVFDHQEHCGDIAMTECDKKCCANCKNHYALYRNEYYEGGCCRSYPKGYVCMLYADEGVATWLTGLNENEVYCEGFVPKRKKGFEADGQASG